MSDKKAKKAFKEAFGVSTKSKDWDKIADAMNKKWAEAKNIVTLLPPPPNTDAVQANTDLNNTVLTAVQQGNRNFSTNKRTGGLYIRDTVLPIIQTFLNTYRKIARTTPRTVDVGGTPVDIYWTDIPGFAELPTAQRDVAALAVARKVLAGKQVIDAILDPQGNPPAPDLNSISDMMWALKTKAQEKNGPYLKGAMIVPSRGDALRQWLDGCGAEVYPRSSSHLVAQQKLAGQSARGMDFYDGTENLATNLGNNNADGLLPAGMNTMLYQQVTLPNGSKAMYLKMETAGAYGTAKWNKLRGISDATAPAPRPSRPEDKAHAKEHGANYMSGKKEKDLDLGAKREDVPKEVKQAWTAFLKQVPNKLARSRLTLAAKGGFALNKVLPVLETLDGMNMLPTGPTNAFLDVVEEHAGVVDSEGAEMKFGGEAVVTEGDLA